jgi:tetratricopeptide (TPR) repeat protein
MLHFCAGDEAGARPLFERSLSIDDEGNPSRLMLFLIDWRAGRAEESPHREALLALDWRSPAEFLGYLAQVLEGRVPLEKALTAGENLIERSWLSYIGGLLAEEKGETARAGELLAQAALGADPEDWAFFLARSSWDRVQRELEEKAGGGERQSELRAGRETFEADLARAMKERTELKAQISALLRMAAQDSVGLADKRRAFEQVLTLEPDRTGLLAGLAFYAAAEGDFQEALGRAGEFLDRPGRESAVRLSLGLLEPQLLLHLDREEEARTALESYLDRTADPWYRSLAECLDGRLAETDLEEKIGASPEHLLTGHAVLGFWAEGQDRQEEARRHYRQALESFLDTWLEFDLVRERLRRLRTEGSVEALHLPVSGQDGGLQAVRLHQPSEKLLPFPHPPEIDPRLSG